MYKILSEGEIVMEYKSIFQERFTKALKIRQVRQIDISNKTGISSAQINEYIAGKCKPKQDKLYLIGIALNVNPAWLMGFDVPMDEETTPIKQRILHKVDELNEEQLGQLEVIMNTIFKS